LPDRDRSHARFAQKKYFSRFIRVRDKSAAGINRMHRDEGEQVRTNNFSMRVAEKITPRPRAVHLSLRAS
jgi:hypothetical protein